MKLLAKFVLTPLFLLNLFFGNVALGQGEPGCARWIYSTGRFLGWGDALLEYTQPREAPSPFDQIIYEQLQEAFNSIERAALDCAPAIPAWPGWRQKQTFLSFQIEELQNTANHKFKRGRVYNTINSTYYSWASELSIMVVNGEVILNTTCATCYFQLGFSTAYAAQAYRQAQEALSQNNEREAKRQMQFAEDYLMRAREVLRTYAGLQTRNCANLDILNLQNRINEILKNALDLNSIANYIEQANFISDNIQTTLDGGGNLNTTNSYEYCQTKYCPECDNSIVLLGEAVDEDCQKCLDENKDLIAQCMNGSTDSDNNVDENSPNTNPILPAPPSTPATRTQDIQNLLNQADCANVSGAIAEWDPVTQQVICLCVDEYETWNPQQKKCVRDIQAILTNSDCSHWPNTEPKWDYSNNEPYCDCIAGYEWNEDYSKCISLQEKLVSQTDCSQYGNAKAVWDPANNEVVCECLPGYEWDENYTKCISIALAGMQNYDCSGYPNTQAVWDPVSQQAYCDCLPGYEWNDDFSGCEQPIQQQQQPVQYDCSHLPNSRPVFDPVLNEMVCDCMPGFEWNRDFTACIPVRNKPNIDWGNIISMTNDILNGINMGNQGVIPSGTGSFPTGTSMQQPVQHQSNCNDQQQSGGNAPEVHNIDLGQSFGSFIFDYDTESIKDQIIITNGGRTIFNTGCVGERKAGIKLNISGSPTISVRVNPNCDGSNGTSWSFTVHCPTN